MLSILTVMDQWGETSLKIIENLELNSELLKKEFTDLEFKI